MYKIVDHADGFLAIMPRPDPGDMLHDEIAGLARLGVTTLVSLLEAAEERELSLSAESDIAAAHDIEFVSYPIEDRTIPCDLTGFIALINGLAAQVLNGRGVAIHCYAGIGRSGITAAAVLVRMGYDADKVFAQISEARGYPVPDTYEQMEWFGRHYPKFMAEFDSG